MEYKKIIELTTVVTGGTPSTEKREYWDNGSIPWLQSGCCQNCEVNSAGKYITQEGYDNSSTRMMPADTVMIALTGATAGKVGYLNFAACGNQSITGILPCGALNQRYLFYYLISQRHKILADCVGGAQAHISQGYVKNIKVPVLSLVEQEQVVEVLTQLNNIISMRRKEIGLLDTLVKSRFAEMFGDVKYGTERWGGKPFKDITINLDSKRKPVKDADSKKMQCIYQYYGATGIVDYVNDYRQDGDFLLISEDGKALELRSKPIAFLASGKIWVNNHAHVQQCTDECNMIYLMYHINFMDISIWVTGIDQKKLNRANLDIIPIALPPIELQNQFADFVVSVDKSKSKIQKSLEETQLLFDSLMQKYFG